MIVDDFKSRRVMLDLPLVDERVLGFQGQTGLLLPTLLEMYGPEHSGKSTTALYMGAKVAGDGEIVFCDTEGTTAMTPDYAKTVVEHAGFTGTLRFISMVKKGKMRPHEEMLQEAYEYMLEPNVRVGVLDSIGLFTPTTELKKKVGERDVGQKPKSIADLSRKLMYALRETALFSEPKLFIYVNHKHPEIGGQGFWTPGGLTKQQAAGVRLWLRRRESDVPEGTGNFCSSITAQKLKVGSGHPGRTGHIYFVPGFGIVPQMSALFDALDDEILKRPPGGIIKTKVNGEWVDMDKIGTLLGKALEGNYEAFEPIYEALRGQ